MAHLHLYMNNPTTGAIDGTEISSKDETLPLALTLDANVAEKKAAKVAVRCDSGYKVDGETSIYFEGKSVSKWQLAADNDYPDAETALTYATWATTLNLPNVAATNVVFWVNASSSTSDSPSNDRSVDLIAEGVVVAASSSSAG